MIPFSQDVVRSNEKFVESLFAKVLQESKGYIEIRSIPNKGGMSHPSSDYFSSVQEVLKEEEVLKLKALNDNGSNIYFGVCLRKRQKGTKADVEWVSALWADLDAKHYDGGKDEALSRLKSFKLQPTFIIDSGHGYHAYWLLEAPVNAVDTERNVEDYMRGIERYLGSDAVHDLSRVMRFPGFMNVKDANNPVQCLLIEENYEAIYKLTDFDQFRIPASNKRKVKSSTGNAGVPERFLDLLKTNKRLSETYYGTCKMPKDSSRSGYDMSLANQLSNLEFSSSEIAVILKSSPSGKGSEASNSYVEHTIGKALTGAPKQQEKDRKNTSSRLIELVDSEDVELFHTDLQVPCARMKVGSHYEIRSLNGKPFQRWLARLYWEDQGQALGGDAMNSAIDVLEAKAMFEGEEHKLFNRVAKKDGAIWYDLSDTEWRAVKITPSGWEVVDHPPILFQRYSHHLAQATPKRGGNVQDFLNHFHISDQATQLLFLSVVLSYFVPGFPHPALVVHGPHGSAKTTSLSLIRRLIDPSKVPTIGLTGLKDFAQILDHNYFIPLDNLSELDAEVSDMLCRAISGTGGFKRELFTTDEDFVYAILRCIALNGINNIVNRPDLIERCIFVELARIPEERRSTEGTLWPRFEEALPAILGGCFDVLAKAMALEPDVQLKKMPRMADFTRWGCALTTAMGLDKQSFLDAYAANMASQNEDAVSEEPVGLAMIEFAKSRAEWTGDYTQLLALLNALAHEKSMELGPAWPKKPNKLSEKINALTPTLALAGVFVTKIAKRTVLIRQIETAADDRGGRNDGLGDFGQVNKQSGLFSGLTGAEIMTTSEDFEGVSS